MLPEIVKATKIDHKKTNIFLISKISDLPQGSFDEHETRYITHRLAEKDQNKVILNKLGHITVVCKLGSKEVAAKDKELEKTRKTGESLLGIINEYKIASVCIITTGPKKDETIAFAEGMALGNYQFLKYRKDREEKESSLKKIEIVSSDVDEKEISELNILCKAVYTCRSLINEPLLTLNAEKMASDFEVMAHEAGIKIEVLTKQKIEALKMGGLLAVNYGSVDPPTFSIMEYKPEGAVNTQPIVFVGKGVVYDTGGMSLKPSP